MLDEYMISVTNKKEFDEFVNRYFVNMTNNARTLHITDKCHYAKYASSFITFSNMEEVADFEKNNMNSTPFRRCGKCFKD